MAFKKAAVAARPQSFAIKGALLPMTLLELKSLDIKEVISELTDKVNAAPDFFVGTPVVLSVEHLDAAEAHYLAAIIDVCLGLGFRLAGLKGDAHWLVVLAEQMRLGHFPAGKARPAPEVPVKHLPEAQVPTTNVTAPVIDAKLSKTITMPIRSGQQVFSEGDLIVLAPVSAGAEVLAVGNIHIYAPLRGRALAGVKGDASARIFCLSQEAELVSIAGHFMIDENLRKAHWKVAAQVFFEGGELKVEPLVGSFS